MKPYIVAVTLLTTLFAGCEPSPDSSHPTTNPKVNGVDLGDYASIPSCGIKLRPPNDFEPATSFDGFEHPETDASILAMSLPGPFEDIGSNYTAEQMEVRGWTLRSKQEVEVEGLPGIFVHFEQPSQGNVDVKWSLIFGDEQNTTMVTAACPKEHEAKFSTLLKTAVLSTRLDSSAQAPDGRNAPFILLASERLKISTGTQRMMAYTKDGTMPLKSSTDPLFVASASSGAGEVTDQRQFAEQRIRETALTKGLTLTSTAAIQIDGLHGFESLANARDVDSGVPLVVYQVMLFDNDSCIVMQGLVGEENSEEYLPEFKAMARSLRRNRR